MIRTDEFETQPSATNKDVKVVFLDQRRVGRILKRADGSVISYSAMVYWRGGIGAMTHGHKSITAALYWIGEVITEMIEAAEEAEDEEEL